MSHNKKHKVVVTAPLNFETAAMLEVANSLGLPPEEERQPDLQYITAIFVSSGMNKNGAVFLGSELIKARKTIESKAVDIEHEEQLVVGHIISSAFVEQDGTVFDAEAAAQTMSTAELDTREMDVAIAAIVHKTRFPFVASEIMSGEWMVSMEAFYSDYDIKVGDLIISREQAEKSGYDKLVGSVVQLKDGNSELGFHLVGRVLRGIVFAGVGLVKNPANPRSIIMETAAMKDHIASSKEEAVVMDVAAISDSCDTGNCLTKEEIVEAVKEAVADKLADLKPVEVPGQEDASDYPGICVNYKRYVASIPGADSDDLPEPPTDLSQYPLETQPGTDAYPPGTVITREHYCSLFDLDCTARPGDATHPDCWRNVFARTVKEEVHSYEEVLRRRRIAEGLVSLQEILDRANK